MPWKAVVFVLSVTMITASILQTRTDVSTNVSREDEPGITQVCQNGGCGVLATDPPLDAPAPRRGEDLIPKDHCVLEAMRKSCPWEFSCFLGTLAPFVADTPTIVKIQTQTQRDGAQKGYRFTHRKDSHCHHVQIRKCLKQAEQDCEMNRLLGL